MKREYLDRSPGYQLWLATNAWQRIMRKSLEPLHLTHVQFVLLASIDLLGSSGPVTQAKVARFAEVDENMTSQVIRSLVERNLVTRVDHPTDARAWCLALTSDGDGLLKEAKQLVRPARDGFFSPLGDRSDDFVSMLQTIVLAARQDHHEIV